MKADVGVPVSEQDAEAMVDRMCALSPHPEAKPVLTRLTDTSVRMVALTNSVEAVGEAQLKSAAMRDAEPHTCSDQGW